MHGPISGTVFEINGDFHRKLQIFPTLILRPHWLGPPGNLVSALELEWKKRSERRKYCALAVVRRSPKKSPRPRPPSRGRHVTLFIQNKEAYSSAHNEKTTVLSVKSKYSSLKLVRGAVWSTSAKIGGQTWTPRRWRCLIFNRTHECNKGRPKWLIIRCNRPIG